MSDAEDLKRVASVLKKHFMHLDVIKTIDIANEILSELKKGRD